jgi:hypothetical protein
MEAQMTPVSKNGGCRFESCQPCNGSPAKAGLPFTGQATRTLLGTGFWYRISWPTLLAARCSFDRLLSASASHGDSSRLCLLSNRNH